MSENNNNRKKNFFKRLSGFKKFLVIYASVLVVIIAVALVLLYGLLKDYEAGRPANTMDKLVSHIEAGNVGKWIKDAGILGEFETEDIVSDYFKDTFADKEVSYKKKAGEYTENNPVYILYADDKKIANVTLTEKKKNAHKFTEWKLASINGVNVSSDYITGEADVSLCKHVGDYVTTPVDDVYNINGMFAKPEVKVTYNGKELDTEYVKDGYEAYYPSDDELLSSEKSHILTVAENYGKYMINRGSLSTLSSYMIGNAKEYMSDIPAIDVYLIGRTFTYDITDENVSNFRKYSDDCYSCDVDYNLNVKWSSGSTTYNISLTYVFVKQNDKWMLADFSIR